jgi:hypothetical protein
MGGGQGRSRSQHRCPGHRHTSSLVMRHGGARADARHRKGSRAAREGSSLFLERCRSARNAGIQTPLNWRNLETGGSVLAGNGAQITTAAKPSTLPQGRQCLNSRERSPLRTRATSSRSRRNMRLPCTRGRSTRQERGLLGADAGRDARDRAGRPPQDPRRLCPPWRRY